MVITPKHFLGRLAALATALCVMPGVTPAWALDERFQDADGDLVADVPSDLSQLIDPGTLIFAYTPVEDPAVYAKAWQGFLKHLQKETGRRVVFFPVHSNAAQIEAMRAGRLHVAAFNTGSNPLAVNCAGFVPFAMMADKNGAFGYEMEIITYPSSGLEKVQDIKGKKIAFTSQTSNSGYKAPSAILRDEFKLEPNTDYEPVFSGKHDNSVLGVANKDYPAAAVANSVKLRMLSRGVVKPEQLKVLYKSQTFPTSGYGIVHNMKPELADKIRKAFFSFNWEGSELLKEFSKTQPPQETFIPITYKNHWAVVRDVDKAMGVSYACK